MKKFLFVFGLAALFAACGDSSSTSSGDTGSLSSAGEQNNLSSSSVEGDGSVCGFSKADNTWKYSFSSWEYVHIYTWVDESTVEYKEYLNDYHMDRNDTTYTEVNRDEFYEKVLKECQSYNDIDVE
ncbi:hypothetical protein [Fibrobacter sp.]|uniref:hypothetical protein n=1 Tax=Fibrobacter sp. TaxID=35828 RepID=UPI003865DCD7